jgi:F-box/leucine-rich repeat protein 2/20
MDSSLLSPAHQTSIPLPADVRPAALGSQLELTVEVVEESKAEDAQEIVEEEGEAEELVQGRKVNFWPDLPPEIKVSILQYLSPRETVSCSRVSKDWHAMCFDGQLWARLDTATYYSEIPRDSLVKIIIAAGPFLRSLNLRGCIQLESAWITEGQDITDTCRNLLSLNVEDCQIDNVSVHSFLRNNPFLTTLSMRGLTAVANSTTKIISQTCTNLEHLNVSWCKGMDTKGLKRVVKACPRLKDLRVSELAGFEDEDFMLGLFQANTLERLIMSHCSTITDASLKVLLHGTNPDYDLLTGRPIVPPRRLKHLDLSRCRGLTDAGVKYLAHCVPSLEILQLAFCPNLTDDALTTVIETTPGLSHLDLEELEHLTNHFIIKLSNADCAATLEHLNISYCERIGDAGLLKLLKSAPNIRSLDLDNTRISDLTLMEICTQMRKRGTGSKPPVPGLRLAVFDCGNVTWTGIREILSYNASVPRATCTTFPLPPALEHLDPADSTPSVDLEALLESTPYFPPPPFSPSSTARPRDEYPKEIIQLKCFYGWQMTVDEHTKRVLRGNHAAAKRLERKWADYMMATEEAGVAGAGARRRRRRARDAEALFAEDDDEDNWYGPGGLAPLGGRRRRARSGGCMVM